MVLTVFPGMRRQFIERLIAHCIVSDGHSSKRALIVSELHHAANYFVLCQSLAHYRAILGRQPLQPLSVFLDETLPQLSSSGDIRLGKLAKEFVGLLARLIHVDSRLFDDGIDIWEHPVLSRCLVWWDRGCTLTLVIPLTIMYSQ